MLNQIKETLAHLYPEETASPLDMAKDAVSVIDTLVFEIGAIAETLGVQAPLDTGSRSLSVDECEKLIAEVMVAARQMRAERDAFALKIARLSR